MSEERETLTGEGSEKKTVLTGGGIQLPAAGEENGVLVMIHGERLGLRISLESVMFVGRAEDAEVSLNDDAASRRHAKVAWTGSSYVLRDLGSTNGTFVNNQKVVERTLKPGDRVQIGRTIFKFLHGNDLESAYHEEIYRLVTHDGLTKALNKRSFDEALDRELSRSRRYARPLSLVLFDLDHFKAVNDDHGHLAGDAVLYQVAVIVADSVRRDDVFARIGGEEFAILLPEVELAGARIVAEKLRGLIADATFSLADVSVRVTASFGVAQAVADNEAAERLIKAADERLYQAKGAGRNRVC